MRLNQLMETLRQRRTDIERYELLRNLQQNHAGMFFQLLFQHTEELLPYVYTPTVGQACQEYCKRGFSTRGLYLSATDKGRMLQKLRAWPQQDISLAVVTDGERILGLGDLGVGGMGISEGKALLYTVAGGVPPASVLPVCLDVGTNNKALLEDPTYTGLRQRRLTGAAYDAAVDEFMSAVRAWRPHVMVQFEDFGNTNAFRVLNSWRDRCCCFNDDMQGTAAVTLAGLLAGLRATGGSLEQQTFLFLGAGEAGTAIGDLIAQQLVRRHGLSLQEARGRCHFIDSRGLVCAARLEELQHHKLPFAHDRPFLPDLESAVQQLRPSVLIGVAAQPGAFTPSILRLMARHHQHLFVFPLSNPTSLAECTAQQAFDATEGRVVFASGSPNAALALPDGRQVVPAQANNAYIFPAVGHAAVITRCSSIPDSVFLEAAEALGAMSGAQQLAQGRLFPPLSQIRQACDQLTAHLAQFMVASGLGQLPEGVAEAPRGVQAWLGIVRQRCFAPSDAVGATPAGGGSSGRREQQQPAAQQLVVAHSKL
ncbi:cytosolic NADP malic enzyme [Scenedesmus sp. NREL 46B-D3]|nr:cytosolic NADP malic enzyme [Scenedesmus sp. NREL 46B-D3]